MVEVSARVPHGVHRPPHQQGHEVLLAEDLVEQEAQVRQLLVADRYADEAVGAQQIAGEHEARNIIESHDAWSKRSG